MSDKELENLQLGEKAARLLIQMSGETADREGLKDTPRRMSRAYQSMFAGYHLTPKDVVGKGVFNSESPGLIAISQIEFYSFCEHHLLPFWGKASVGYYPKDKILGLSKIPRIIEVFSKRLQVQERLTQQVCDALHALVDPRAVYVQMQGQHMCMMMRGVEKACSFTVTEACRGIEGLTESEKRQIFNIPQSMEYMDQKPLPK